MAPFELQLCDIQGRLYELAIRKGYDGVDFSTKFMRSATAAFSDLPCDRLQWAGEEYILADLLAETPVAMAIENLKELYRQGSQVDKTVEQNAPDNDI